MVRRAGRVGLAAGLVALGFGLAVALGAAVVAGDWWLAPEPWIGLGLTLIAIGLALTAIFALLLDAIEPLGWWRLLALPPAAVVASLWSTWLIVGVATTGPGPGPERDITTILYSLPDLLAVASVATVLLTLPLLAGRLRRGKRLAST